MAAHGASILSSSWDKTVRLWDVFQVSKRATWNELAEKELVVATFDEHLPNLPLMSIEELKLSFPLASHDSTLLSGYEPKRGKPD